MTIRKELVIPTGEFELIEKLCNEEPKTESDCFGEDETMSYTVDFGNGYEMDIKVCGVQYEEGGNNTAWTEAVLFLYGSEIACSDPSDGISGEWELEDDDGNTYIVDVSPERIQERDDMEV